jgi:RNA polymerase sigma-70 factor, ECF subfamily
MLPPFLDGSGSTSHQHAIGRRLASTDDERPRPAGPNTRDQRGQSTPSRTELERVRARNRDGLGAFFETYFERVYSLVHRLCGDRSIAEDLTQEVFLNVHRSAHTLDPARDPWPWLMSILYNAFKDLMRSAPRKVFARSVSIEQKPNVAKRLWSTTPSPEEEVSARERDELLQRAILNLPPDQRIAVLLHCYGNMVHREIAIVLGMSEGATRKCYSRAVDALGKQLQKGIR